MGIVKDKSECFIAFMKTTVATRLSEPPMSRAIQNWLVKVGILMKKSIGSKNTKEKNVSDQATTYSSMSLRLFLLKTSFMDSKNAVKNA
jgi:hypothetical protein